jgi:hypothetical protein
VARRIDRSASGQRALLAALAAVTAARMPARIRLGLGGHPGTSTSTGMTLRTAPALA